MRVRPKYAILKKCYELVDSNAIGARVLVLNKNAGKGYCHIEIIDDRLSLKYLYGYKWFIPKSALEFIPDFRQGKRRLIVDVIGD